MRKIITVLFFPIAWTSGPLLNIEGVPIWFRSPSTLTAAEADHDIMYQRKLRADFVAEILDTHGIGSKGLPIAENETLLRVGKNTT